MTTSNFSSSQLNELALALGTTADKALAEAAAQGINPADVVSPPRAILKDKTTFKFRIGKSTFETADRGKKAGQAQMNLQIAPVDANGKVNKKGTSFLRSGLPFDTEGYKYNAQDRERAYRDFVSLVSGTPAGKACKQINLVKVGSDNTYIDNNGNPLKGDAYSAAQVKERILFTKLARELHAGTAELSLVGVEFYAMTSHSEWEGKTNVWFQNISNNPPTNSAVELVAGKMTVIPGGPSAGGADEDVSF